MHLPHEAMLLRVFIGESDRWERRPLYEALVLKAQELHLAGATVLRGPMGFGKSSRLHTAKILQLSMDLPLVIEIVDAETLDDLARKLRQEVQNWEEKGESTTKLSGEAKIKKLGKRLKIVEALRSSGNKPQWMVLTRMPCSAHSEARLFVSMMTPAFDTL